MACNRICSLSFEYLISNWFFSIFWHFLLFEEIRFEPYSAERRRGRLVCDHFKSPLLASTLLTMCCETLTVGDLRHPSTRAESKWHMSDDDDDDDDNNMYEWWPLQKEKITNKEVALPTCYFTKALENDMYSIDMATRMEQGV
ncbi:hypothetical protein EJ02DRAFT_121961 [Clathrospora elynae]|uniref:Uncharacterized protein n=1 Tax=Clathrospora elynae TaxID=706981 RepID=A0A6A5SZ14_9PLEO|nr:hypothetical protein EJ02DRAFT_121961 [Clathrospora elynae]